MTTTLITPEPVKPATALRVRCPKCGEAERVPHEAIGRKAQCNRCKTMFRIAAPGTLPAARVATPPPLPLPALPPLSTSAPINTYAVKATPNKVRQRALIGLVIGIGLIALGVIVTSVSYDSASNGGTYLVLWGPVLVGIGMTFRSVYRLISGAE